MDGPRVVGAPAGGEDVTDRSTDVQAWLDDRAEEMAALLERRCCATSWTGSASSPS